MKYFDSLGRELHRKNNRWTLKPSQNMNVCADDFKYGTHDYYAQLAIDYMGLAVRDNTYGQLVSIGRRIEDADETD